MESLGKPSLPPFNSGRYVCQHIGAPLVSRVAGSSAMSSNPTSGDSNSTQLYDSRPKFDTPLRISLPLTTPERKAAQPSDTLIGLGTFSATALRINRSSLNNESRKEYTPPSFMDQDAKIKTSIKNFTLLALSSKRGGKKEVEAQTQASLALICDNEENYLQAIDYYKVYLQICEELGDFNGCAAACNNMGVDYMLMALPMGSLFGFQPVLDLSALSREYIKIAIECHNKQLEVIPDEGSAFVVNINLALCHCLLNKLSNAAKCNQDALRIAIKIKSLYGQSIAVGNLGKLALYRNDFETAKTCFEQHLQLVQALSDHEAELKAWQVLGHIKYTLGDSVSSVEALDQAKRIAIKYKYFNDLRKIQCLIGISQGSLHFEDYSDSINNVY